MRGPAALILVAVLSAGCAAKSPDATSGPGGPTVTQTPVATLAVEEALPDWAEGQTWTYAVEIPGAPTSRFKMIVSERDEDLWIVATDNRTQALHHALYSVNPVLGRITTAGLSPYQSGEPVEMYRFPLADRRTWTGAFFGEPMRFEATYDDAIPTLPGVFLPGFHVRARGESGAHVDYSFVPAVEWFTDFQVFNATGAKEFHLSLEAFGAEYRGPYHFLRGQDLYAATVTASTDPANPPRFAVDAAGALDAIGLGIRSEGRGPQQAVLNLTVRDPAGSPAFALLLVLPPGEFDARLAELPVAPGSWTVEALVVGPAVAEVRIAGLRSTAGTL